MYRRNPFVPNKIDWERRPVIWLSRTARQILTDRMPAFVCGSRGSGKSSILRSISTRRIFEYEGLRPQLRASRLDWFGVYIQLEDLLPDLIDAAASHIHNNETAPSRRLDFIFFASYIEMAIVETLLADFQRLTEAGHMKVSADSEARATGEFVRRYPFICKTRPSGEYYSLKLDLMAYRRGLFDQALRGGTGSWFSELHAAVPGEMAKCAAELFLPTIRGNDFINGSKLQFLVLVDDCEVLPPNQQPFLNAMVRSGHPVIWVLAFAAGLYDAITAEIPNQTLSDADRKFHYLDEMREPDFKALCQNVASLRLFYHIPPSKRSELKRNDPLKAFDLKARLGDFSLNEILDQQIQSRLSSAGHSLREQAILFRDELKRKAPRSEIKSLDLSSAAPAYWQFVAVSSANMNIDDYVFDERRFDIFRQTLARKQRAAFMHASRIAGLDRLPYIGYDIIIALSDSCIRDFLDIMAELFVEDVGAQTPTSSDDDDQYFGRVFRFTNSIEPINADRQRIAVYRSSQAKIESIFAKSFPHGAKAEQVIMSLGTLTAALQYDPRGNDGLSTPERGVFVVDIGMLSEMASVARADLNVEALVNRIEENGFLREVFRGGFAPRRVLETRTAVRRFRLHRRFAPQFGFSFRGAYEDVELSDKQLFDLFFRKSGFEVSDWVKSIQAGFIRSAADQRDLFE